MSSAENTTSQPTPAPSAPAGWYPDTEGQPRYWDGARWLGIPAPSAATSSGSSAPNNGAQGRGDATHRRDAVTPTMRNLDPAPPERKTRRGRVIAMVGGIVVVVAAVAIVILGRGQGSAHAPASNPWYEKGKAEGEGLRKVGLEESMCSGQATGMVSLGTLTAKQADAYTSGCEAGYGSGSTSSG